MTKKTAFLAASIAFLTLSAAGPSFAQDNGLRTGPRGAPVAPSQPAPRSGRQDDGQRQWQGNGRGEENRAGDGQRNWQGRGDGQRQGGGQQTWQGGQRQGGQGNPGNWQGQRNGRDDNDRNWGRDAGHRYGATGGRDDHYRRDDERRYGGSGAGRRNDNYRRDDHRRAYTAVPYGGYFGRSYGSIATRYYGRNYVYYGSRSWSSWDRPWRVGYSLPPRLYCSALPYELAYDLPPPPWGYDYILCGRDILLVNDSRVVVDAILPW